MEVQVLSDHLIRKKESKFLRRNKVSLAFKIRIQSASSFLKLILLKTAECQNHNLATNIINVVIVKKDPSVRSSTNKSPLPKMILNNLV